MISTYGNTKGRLIISALTQDIPKVDLIFAIDTTGSMGPYIDAVKTEAANIVGTLTDPAHPVDFRIGLVDYKDLYSNCPSDGYAAQIDLPISSDEGAIISAINALGASGGCDTPESVYSGLMTAIHFPWRSGVSKAIIQMGDAPPHDPEATTGYTADSVVAAAIAVDPAVIYPIDINGGGGPSIQSLATRTGGKVFPATTASDITNAILNVIGTVSTPTNLPQLPMQAQIKS